jgi:hypothetical protein
MTNVVDVYGVTKDAKMTFLHRALDAAHMTSALQESLRCELSLNHIEVRRYKAARRCLIAYTFERGAGLKTVLGKVRAKGLDTNSYVVQSYLYQAGLAVPEPLGVIPGLNMWLQENLSGVSLAETLTASKALPLMTCTATELYKLHQLSPATSKHHTVHDELTILSERMQRVAVLQPAWSEKLKRVLESCKRLASSLPELPPRSIHRDFYADQVLVGNEKVYLLDFDLYTRSDPALDVGNFLGHLTELALRQGDVDLFGDLEKQVESAYLALNQEVTRARVQVYKTLTLARHIYISTQFVERQAFTQKLLELCLQRLAVALS